MQTLIIYNYYINSSIPPKKCDAMAFPTIIPTRPQTKSDKNTSNGKAVCSNDSPTTTRLHYYIDITNNTTTTIIIIIIGEY